MRETIEKFLCFCPVANVNNEFTTILFFYYVYMYTENAKAIDCLINVQSHSLIQLKLLYLGRVKFARYTFFMTRDNFPR